MAALLSLQNYESGSEGSNEEHDENTDEFNAHLKPVDKPNSVAASLMLIPAPEVESNVSSNKLSLVR